MLVDREIGSDDYLVELLRVRFKCASVCVCVYVSVYVGVRHYIHTYV